jgi:hypothetical protein
MVYFRFLPDKEQQNQGIQAHIHGYGAQIKDPHTGFTE